MSWPLPTMRREDGHPDELRSIRTRCEADADVADRGDAAVGRFDAHAQERRVLHEVLPVEPLRRAALLHPMLFAVALRDERIAVLILELARAVTRR